jgi:hypothetical protein
MTIEAHQRKIRLAMHRLNKALEDAGKDNLYVDFDPVTTENNDTVFLALKIREWQIDEPKPVD